MKEFSEFNNENIKPVENEKNLEIERKFLLSYLPDERVLQSASKKEISQGYIEISDEKEERVRCKGNKYFHTIKEGSGKTRIETEKEISKEEFEKLWPLTEGKRVEKTRYAIPYHDQESALDTTIELDIYQGNLDGLLTAEVEFKNEKDSNKFCSPEWFGEEKTKDKRYKNQQLALKGLPEENQTAQ